jgi:tRNA(fMet)-specific endonuclease VapC
MIWMFDTDILIHFVNRKPGFERIARRMSGRSPGELRLSAITLSELRFGVENGEFQDENDAALNDLLDLFQAEDFPCSAAEDFGEIKTALLSKGKAIGPYDMLIAAHARHIGATVVANNEREFRRVPGLSVENWGSAHETENYAR